MNSGFYKFEISDVNSWNEWYPLKRVIVGRAEGGMLQAPEPAVYPEGDCEDYFPRQVKGF